MGFYAFGVYVLMATEDRNLSFDYVLYELKRVDDRKILSKFRDSFVKRRLMFRAIELGMTPEEYCKYALDNLEREYEKVVSLLMINVTEFFRDLDVFKAIEEDVIQMIYDKTHGAIRVWSSGCATGEETYSIALILYEYLKSRGENPYKAMIIGSDINRNALRIAHSGVYPITVIKNIPDKYKKYFHVVSEEYVKISEEIARMVVFKYENIFDADYPNDYFDMVLLRNVLIYYSSDSILKMLSKVYSVLKPEGILILGKSEFIPKEMREKFDFFMGELGIRTRIYVKKP
ncbi:MAG: hypothetical protein DRN30_05360 [Thermoplasmata archaeon]|nr:MAG: hypothetical protein DRN30_05360 [Thermoplasmata archaeon]